MFMVHLIRWLLVQVRLQREPLTSLYLMVASVEAAGRYDVFVECVERVWKLVLENAEVREKLPYDFIVHRAAYVFAMETYKRVLACVPAVGDLCL